MRRTTLAAVSLALLALCAVAACTDLREFRGQWQGGRVGDAPVLDVGVGTDARATLVIDTLDPNGLHGQLSVDKLVAVADVTSLAGAEADALSGLTFAGSPTRVYLAFVDTTDGGGQAFAVIALFEDRRVELRLMRGGTTPLYGVFALADTDAAAPVICPSCNAPLGGETRFCGVCGTSLAATARDPSIPTPAPDLTGREIAGRYRIVAKLGEGGMGAVFRAEQISLKRAVALKLLRPDIASNGSLVRRFNAEAELVAKLSHPNTVTIYDFGQDADGSLFIAMELVEGRSLRAELRAAGPLPPARALAIAAQLAASLADAHAHGIIHRDLKPDNAMLQDRGKEHDIVRVLDFGIAKLRDDSRVEQPQMTQAGDMLGTPQYMAPEQIRGEAIDGRTDVYALGCILYEMLTARMPFEAPTVMALLSKHLLESVVAPSQRRPDLGIAPALDELVLAAMAKAPAARPTTMEAYGERIRALLQAAAPPPPKSAPWIAPMGYAGFEDRPVPVELPPAARTPAPPPPMIGGYGGVTATPHAASGLAQARAAAGPTEMVDPLPKPALLQAYGGHARPPLHPAAAKSSPVGLVLILVVIALVGLGGAAAVIVGRSHQTPPADPWAGAAPPSSEAAPLFGVSESAPTLELPTTADPWGAAGDATVGTGLLPVPAAARLSTPWPATAMSDVPGVHLVDPEHQIQYFMVPLFPGSNDVRAQVRGYLGAHPHERLVQIGKVTSAGAKRQTASFVGRDGLPEEPMGEVAAMYVGATYRVGVVVWAPPAKFADREFAEAIQSFFENGVELP